MQGSLRAERGQIRAYKAVALVGHLFQVNVITQLHVLCVDTKDFKATCVKGTREREKEGEKERKERKEDKMEKKGEERRTDGRRTNEP